MFAQAQRRLNLSRGIRHALDNGDFRVVYQPIIETSSRKMVGAEALLRWRYEDGQWVPPQEFIRVAEETGMIGRLGEFVLDQALSDLARWKSLSRQPPWLAVNVSGAQIHEDGFAERISVLLHRHGIDPKQLHLEITEEVLIENLTRNRNMLHTLDQIGLQIGEQHVAGAVQQRADLQEDQRHPPQAEARRARPRHAGRRGGEAQRFVNQRTARGRAGPGSFCNSGIDT